MEFEFDQKKSAKNESKHGVDVRATRRLNSVKARSLDRELDAGGRITRHLDLSGARRPGRKQKRVDVGSSGWMIDSLDREARRLGADRQSIIKIWIAERPSKDAAR